jgi:hypothetical protein
VAAVAGSADPDGDIASLLRAEIVREVRRFPELECTFRHGLLQEAALSTLTPTSQRELYGRVGRAMETHLGDHVDEQLEQLAFYFYRSDDTGKGFDYLDRAAEHAARVEALERAEELWKRARRLAERRATTHEGRFDRQLGGCGSVRAASCRSPLPRPVDRESYEAARPAAADRRGIPAANEIGTRTRSRWGRFVRPSASACGSPTRPLGASGRSRTGRRLEVQVRAGEVEHRLVGERAWPAVH